MKYRKSISRQRVAFGFNGILQDDLEAYQGFMEVADRESWRVIPLYENFEGRLRTLVSAKAVDGVVGKFISAAWVNGLPRNLPCVHLGASPLESIPSVVPDTVWLGRQAAEHLDACGCQAMIWYAGYRMEGIREGMESVCPGRVAEARTLDSLRSFLEVRTGAGIFCLTDYHARQAVTLCRQIGVQVPEEVCILGIGDRFWDGVIAGLGISSIPIPHRLMGQTAAHQLRDVFEGSGEACISIRPGTVRIRESSRLAAEGQEMVLQVQGWLEDRLADPPAMEELARQVGMSRRGFERRFSEAAGCTPYEFLLQLRTEAAMRLLQETDWSVGRIGADVGIPDPSRFSAFLKKRTGKSPMGWRV